MPDGHGGWTIDRINEAYHTGEADKLPGGGGATAAAAVTHNFGIPIDHFVALDFAGFTSLIDALGGIDLDVPKTLTATVLPRGDTGGYEYTFFAGRQHLNGELALAYSRFRLDAEGDFGRIKRQQSVVLAAQQRALSLGWVDQPLSVWNKYHSAVRTDIPSYQLPGFALLAKQMEGHGVAARSLGEAGATTETIIPGSGADVLLPNPDVIARIVAEAFDSPSLGAVTLARLRAIYPSVPGETAGASPVQRALPSVPASSGTFAAGPAGAPQPPQQPSEAQLNPGPGGSSGTVSPPARVAAPRTSTRPEANDHGRTAPAAPSESSLTPPPGAVAPQPHVPTPKPTDPAAAVATVAPSANATPSRRALGSIATEGTQPTAPLPASPPLPISAPSAATATAR